MTGRNSAYEIVELINETSVGWSSKNEVGNGQCIVTLQNHLE